jgi:hypothetical protein
LDVQSMVARKQNGNPGLIDLRDVMLDPVTRGDIFGP